MPRNNKQNKAPADIKTFMEELRKPLDKGSELLLKQPQDWTEEEVLEVMKSQDYGAIGSPQRKRAFSKVQSWFEHHYGNEPVRHDSSGKMIQPKFKTLPNQRAVPVKTSDGYELPKAMDKIGKMVAQMAVQKGLSQAVGNLQTGLNVMPQLTQREPLAPQLKEDGVFGRKTKDAMLSSLIEKGKSNTENALALGAFKRLIDDAKRRGDAIGLESRIDQTVGPLFGHKPSRHPRPTYKAWHEALQGTMNDNGVEICGQGGWRNLKEDGIVGPKTEAAFSSLAKRADPEVFAARICREMGLFGA
ncbi:MAG: hypothetical protein OQK35_05655 [Alphaproteobacteria bacterium]|nr:hypothetical protein [Alphaproteobacteria bacterium]